MGGPVEPRIGTGYPGLDVFGSGVSTLSLGHHVMAEGAKWSRNESKLILIVCLIAGELDGRVWTNPCPMVQYKVWTL